MPRPGLALYRPIFNAILRVRCYWRHRIEFGNFDIGRTEEACGPIREVLIEMQFGVFERHACKYYIQSLLPAT